MVKFQLGPYELDAKSHVVWHEAKIINLPPKAIEFLICLVEHDGAVVSKAELRERVWPGITVEENSVTKLASLIRKAMEPGFGETEVIESVPRRGYRLAVPATLVAEATDAAADPEASVSGNTQAAMPESPPEAPPAAATVL